MPFAIIKSVHAQVPRGESAETLAQDGESPLGVVLIFAVIAIFSAFKRSKAEGVKVLGFCIGVVLLLIFFPSAGIIVVGILGLMIAWGLIQSLL
jgi:hypothetical protein